MHYVILASHGEMATGVLDSVDLICGSTSNIFTATLKRDDKVDISTKIQNIIENIKGKNKIYILTDIFGGSVNNEVLTFASKYDEVVVITGMNLALAITLSQATGDYLDKNLEQIISDAKSQIINCTKMMKNIDEIEEDEL